MTDTELLQALSSIIDTKLAPVQCNLEALTQDINSVQCNFKSFAQDIDSVQCNFESLAQDIDSVKKTSNHLKKEMIKMQAMDEAILDEVERIHDILDKHVKDLAKHSA